MQFPHDAIDTNGALFVVVMSLSFMRSFIRHNERFQCAFVAWVVGNHGLHRQVLSGCGRFVCGEDPQFTDLGSGGLSSSRQTVRLTRVLAMAVEVAALMR